MFGRKKLREEIEALQKKVIEIEHTVNCQNFDGNRIVAGVSNSVIPEDKRCCHRLVTFTEIARYIVDGEPIIRNKPVNVFPGNGGEQKE